MEENLVKKSILVTGATGFLGSYILRYLLFQGFESIYAIRRNSSRDQLIADIKDKVIWVESGLNDIDLLDELMGKVDMVIHAAGLVAFTSSARKALDETNVEGTANLVNLALSNQIEKFVYVSSVAAFGKPTSNQLINELSEWSSSKKNSLYAMSKQLGEREVWRGQAEGLNTVVVNPAYIFGAGRWDEGPMTIVQKIYKGMKFYPTGINGFVDVRDVAKICLLSLRENIHSERFIVSAENVSHQKLFSLIAEELGKPHPTIQIRDWMGFIAWRLEKIKTLFNGKRPIVTKETLLTSSIKFQYDSSKSKEYFNFKYRPVEETIKATCQCFLNSLREGDNVGVLPIL